MRYYITKGGYTVDNQNTVIPMDESSPLYQDYLIYLQEGNTVYEIDYVTPEETADKIASLRKEYSIKISEIEGMREAVERKSIEGTPIPQNILDEREVLREEYRNRILNL